MEEIDQHTASLTARDAAPPYSPSAEQVGEPVHDIASIPDKLRGSLVTNVNLVLVESNPRGQLPLAVLVCNDVCAAMLVDGGDGREGVAKVDTDDGRLGHGRLAEMKVGDEGGHEAEHASQIPYKGVKNVASRS